MVQPLLTLASWGQRLLQRSLFSLLSLFSILLITGSLVAPGFAATIYDLPATPSFETIVLDEANVISRLSEGQLRDRIETLTQNTGSQLHFVVIQRLEFGQTVQDFTAALFDRWFPNPEAQAQQILVVLDTLTEKSGIQVGAAAQALLDPETATSVAQETLLVPIREGSRYNQALFDTVDRLTAILSGQEDPGPPILESNINTERTYATAEETEGSNATVIVIVLLIVATIVPMATYFAYVLR